MNRRVFAFVAAAFLSCGTGAHAADAGSRQDVRHIVDEAVRPMMAETGVPGVAVGVSFDGRQYVFCYGIADKATGRKVTDRTIFEIGSLSKTFTATLASYALQQGKLSLSEDASTYLPVLEGSAFDRVSLLNLATFTAGGLPLQFPDAITDDSQMITYFKTWKPEFRPGTQRLYSNPSIGLFGYLAARSLGASFDDIMTDRILPGLGLTHTFLAVPQAEMGNYAFGYTKQDKAIRVAPGEFDAEAYGIKSTAGDMLRFIDANMGKVAVEPVLRHAIAATHVGYYRAGPMMQGLGWELVPSPTRARLLSANSAAIAFHPNAATALNPPETPADVLINKTGSTNGFGAYAAFLPKQNLGIVILANKNIPIPARVTAAYAILRALED